MPTPAKRSMVKPMNKRQIELHADGNERGYHVVLEINGRKFPCYGKYKSVTDSYKQISDAVKDVYGSDFYEDNDRYVDIINALVCAEDIIRGFHNCFQTRKEGDS